LALHCGNQLGFTAAALVATAPAAAAAAASVLSSDRPSVALPVAGRLIKPQTYLDRTHDARPRSPCVAALSAVCFHEVLPADVWFRRAARQPADERASFDIRRRTLMTQSAAAPGVDVGGQSTCWRQPGFTVGLFEATDDVRRRDDVASRAPCSANRHASSSSSSSSSYSFIYKLSNAACGGFAAVGVAGKRYRSLNCVPLVTLVPFMGHSEIFVDKKLASQTDRATRCQSKSSQLLGTHNCMNMLYNKSMELKHYGRRTCCKQCASSDDATIIATVVNKLDRQRVLLTCRGEIF